ncbi:hypothetical protein JHK87_015943 [Glycine soja]|nr:hypothetical protein JHK87_015943 [Glycine soja]
MLFVFGVLVLAFDVLFRACIVFCTNCCSNMHLVQGARGIGILRSSLAFLLLTRALLCSAYEFNFIVRNIYLCFTTYATISGAECSMVLYLLRFFALFFMQVVPEAAFCPFEIWLMQLFMSVVGWYSCLVTNSFLACKLPINQLVEWRHHLTNSFLACKLAINQRVEWRHRLNLRYFAHLLCIFPCLWWNYLPDSSIQLFLSAAEWYSCLVSDPLLSSKLAINQLVDWNHQLNQRHFANLLCISLSPFGRAIRQALLHAFVAFAFIHLLVFPVAVLVHFAPDARSLGVGTRFLGAVFILYVIISTYSALCVSDRRRWRTSKGSVDVSTSKGSVATHKSSIILSTGRLNNEL